jgi:DNA replication protein DnaC
MDPDLPINRAENNRAHPVETAKAIKGFANIPRTFDISAPSPMHAKIYTALNAYCNKFPAVEIPNIVFSGATGTGKTFAAQIMANILLDRNVRVHYTTAFAMVNAFQKFVQSFGTATEAIDTFLECGLLIIDDLGAEPVIKNITQEHIYNIMKNLALKGDVSSLDRKLIILPGYIPRLPINERSLHNRAFIVTTNLSPADLMNRYDQRIATRILSQGTSSALIKFPGDNLRMKKQ